MRIALIYPPYKHKIFSENLEVVDDEFCSAPPIILAYVAAILERSGHTVMIVDAQVLKIDMNETLSRLRSFNPDLLGFRSESYHFPDALEWMRFLKLQLGKPVFTGGPNLSLYPRETLAHDQIDFGIIGEAIDSLPRLIRALENKQDLAAVPGIAYKRPDRTVLVNAAASVPVDFDAYPFPARHLLPNDKYYSFISQRKNFTIMLTGTGCPYRCKFCAIPHEYRRRSVRNVLAEIEECYKRYSVREIDFFDAALFVDRERTLELLRQLKRLGLDLEWSCRSRVDIVDKEILKAAADAGCRQIYYGIESVDQKILDSMGKRISVGDVKNAIKLTKGCGIRTMGFFMVGNEGDTPDSVRKTIDFAKSLDLDFVQVCQVIAKPGTPLHRQISEATGVDLWKEHIRGNFLSRRLPTLWTGLTEAEIRALTQEFYFRFYFRPAAILKLLFRLRSWAEMRRYLRGGAKFIGQKLKFYAPVITDTQYAEDLLRQSADFLPAARSKQVAIVLPTYNEQKNIRPIVEKIRSVLPEAIIAIVDDNSPDGTGALAGELAAKDPAIRVVHRPKKDGLGTAYKQGFKFIIDNFDVEYIFSMDADLSHDPGYLPVFLHLGGFYDVVSGSRFFGRVSIKNRCLWRNLISKSSKWLINILLGVNLTDMTSGYRCYRTASLKKVDWEKIVSRGYAFQFEIAYMLKNNGAVIKEIPIRFVERTSGVSKISAAIFREAIFIVFRLCAQRIRGTGGKKRSKRG